MAPDTALILEAARKYPITVAHLYFATDSRGLARQRILLRFAKKHRLSLRNFASAPNIWHATLAGGDFIRADVDRLGELVVYGPRAFLKGLEGDPEVQGAVEQG